MYNWRRAVKIHARFPFFHNNLKSLASFKTIALFAIIIVASITFIVSSATPVSVTTDNNQAKLGIYMINYFEKANAGTSYYPSINTQTSIPETSGSFTIPHGNSVNLWTPQFTTAKTVPAGKMPIVLWAQTPSPTPSIDGKATASYNARTGSATLTTTEANDLIYAVVATTSTPSVSISGADLSWQNRGSKANGGAGKVWTFYAISPDPLSSATITASLGNKQNFAMVVFGVSGIDTDSPFDPNLSSVVSSSGSSSTPSVSLTTSLDNDFIIGALFVDNNPTVTAGSGYTKIASKAYSNQVTAAAEYDNAESAGSKTVSYSLSSHSWAWALIGDALVKTSTGPAVSLTVSAYTTNFFGSIDETLFSNQNTNTGSGQVATSFSINQATIPEYGYIKIVLTAPSTTDVTVYWGNGKPTNIQIAFTYDG
jgi:hypothetical protein